MCRVPDAGAGDAGLCNQRRASERASVEGGCSKRNEDFKLSVSSSFGAGLAECYKNYNWESWNLGKHIYRISKAGCRKGGKRFKAKHRRKECQSLH